MGIFIMVPNFCLGDAETRNSILIFLECFEVVAYAVKIMLECAL